MEIVVQKFGGTSVATPEARALCIKHVKNELDKGKSVVVVVSAMGRFGQPYATDTLISLSEEGAPLSKKENDLLLSTGEIISATLFSSLLNKEGLKNVILTGGQAGILTNNCFGSAMILDVNTKNVTEELRKGNVVVIPGFQGSTATGEVTTLGRGGSDTSAAAIAAGLNAESVDIYTDVDGLMTADPRVVEHPLYLESISYQDMAQMAHSGAKVIHPRAVELAMNHDIPMRIKSTFSNKAGTVIVKKVTNTVQYDTKEIMVSGVVSNNDIHRFVIRNAEKCNGQDKFTELFEYLSGAEISIDFINVGENEVVFTVTIEDSIKLDLFLSSGGYSYSVDEEVAKVSVVGNAINGVPGIMSKIVQALRGNEIEIIQTSDSNTTIWLLVKSTKEKQAVRLIHKAFFEL